MLETWNLVRNYTHICIFRKYIFSTWTPYFLSAFFSKKSPFFDKITTFSQSNSMRAVLEIFQFCFHPANICLDEDVWRCLEDVFRLRLQKTSSRRLDQDEYICLSHMSSEDVLIETNIFILVICLQDVFKTSWKNVFKTFSRRLQDVLKTSSRHLQDTFKTSWQDVFKTSSKCYQEILQKRLQDILKTSCKDIFKTFSRHIIKLNCFY